MSSSLRWSLSLFVTLGCAAEIGTPPDSLTKGDAGADAALDVAPDVGPCAPCSVWQVRCGTSCVDLTVNPENCGACNVRCDGRTQVCRSGVCADVTARCASVIPPPADGGVDASVGGDAGAASQGLRAEYYATTNLRTLRQVRVDPTVDFDWTMASPPVVSRETFSARWIGSVRPRYSEAYTFTTSTDDGVRLWVDGHLVVDDWTAHAATERTATVELTAFRAYAIKLEYFNGSGAGSTRLSWSSRSQTREVIPASALTPGDGVDFGCDDGVCCPAGGGTPVCCGGTARCVLNVGYAGCCPAGEACGEAPMCRAPQ